MGIYNKYLVCYDIENDKTRKKFYDEMKNLGLIPVQKSVFYGDLASPEFFSIKKLANELLESETDRCLWIKCNLSESDIKKCFGYDNFKYLEPDGYAAI